MTLLNRVPNYYYFNFIHYNLQSTLSNGLNFISTYFHISLVYFSIVDLKKKIVFFSQIFLVKFTYGPLGVKDQDATNFNLIAKLTPTNYSLKCTQLTWYVLDIGPKVVELHPIDSIITEN